MDNITMPPCTIVHQLVYDDVRAAARWLCEVFGFTERWRAGDHRAQLSFGSGTVAITEPRTSSVVPAVQSLMVRIADVDDHHARVRGHGARIIAEPRTYPYGERQYTVQDPAGHQWTFSESVADVAPETWGGTSGPALHRPADGPRISVMLIVPAADAAIAWYEDALGATRLWDLGGVAGLQIGGAAFFVHAANPDNPREDAPSRIGATSTRIELFVDDPDALVQRALAAGATDQEPVRAHERPWGTHRQGGFVDPFGHRWSVGDPSPLGRP